MPISETDYNISPNVLETTSNDKIKVEAELILSLQKQPGITDEIVFSIFRFNIDNKSDLLINYAYIENYLQLIIIKVNCKFNILLNGKLALTTSFSINENNVRNVDKELNIIKGIMESSLK